MVCLRGLCLEHIAIVVQSMNCAVVHKVFTIHNVFAIRNVYAASKATQLAQDYAIVTHVAITTAFILTEYLNHNKGDQDQ